MIPQYDGNGIFQLIATEPGVGNVLMSFPENSAGYASLVGEISRLKLSGATDIKVYITNGPHSNEVNMNAFGV